MADPYPEVLELEGLIWTNRLRIGRVMARANVSHSTWTRWRNGVAPNTRNLHAVRTAIESLVAERKEVSRAQG